MEQYKKDFIEFMCECEVLKFGDFTTKSGRSTPFFINTGNYMKGSQLKKLGEFYARAIDENFKDDFNVLFGPAYKGIPLAVTTSIALNEIYNVDVSYSSNRKEEKDHGDKGSFLGYKPTSGDKVIIIEDVTTAGTSIYETMPLINTEDHVEVLGLIISVDRMERGREEKSALEELRERFNIRTHSIVSMQEVVDYLYNKQINGKVIIDHHVKQKIDDYYKKYGVKDN